MEPFCHLAGLSGRLCYEIITHLDDASATKLALGGSCARDAVEAHAKIVQQLKLALYLHRPGSKDIAPVDMKHLSVCVRAGFAITSDVASACAEKLPTELVSYAMEPCSELDHMSRNQNHARCIVAAKLMKGHTEGDWTHDQLKAVRKTTHQKTAITPAGGPEWTRLLSTATDEAIIDRVAAAAPAARSKITGPILRATLGSCNFSKADTKRYARDVSVAFAPKTPEDLHSAQPALEALRLGFDDPPFSEAGLRNARSVADEAVGGATSWDHSSWGSLPTSVDVDGQRVHLLMAIDNSYSKGHQQKSATGTGYSRVTASMVGGFHLGYVAKPRSLPTKKFRMSGSGLSEKITEYKTAKQAPIAAATHVAVQAELLSHQMDDD